MFYKTLNSIFTETNRKFEVVFNSANIFFALNRNEKSETVVYNISGKKIFPKSHFSDKNNTSLA